MRTAVKKDELVHIGNFGVDSGQVLITDPCYLDKWENWDDREEPFDNHNNKRGEYGYLGACGVTLTEGHGPLSGFLGVVSTTGWGDGLYPVYAKIGEDDRVAMLVIDFFGELDESGEVDE